MFAALCQKNSLKHVSVCLETYFLHFNVFNNHDFKESTNCSF
jgi:hypothetical protein